MYKKKRTLANDKMICLYEKVVRYRTQKPLRDSEVCIGTASEKYFLPAVCLPWCRAGAKNIPPFLPKLVIAALTQHCLSPAHYVDCVHTDAANVCKSTECWVQHLNIDEVCSNRSTHTLSHTHACVLWLFQVGNECGTWRNGNEKQAFASFPSHSWLRQ